MKSLNLISILILTLSLVLTACDFKKSDPIKLADKSKSNPSGQSVRPEDQVITFEHLQKTVLVTCKNCHAETQDEKRKPLLLTIEHYKVRLHDVAEAINSDSMPPEEEGYKALTACEKAQLDKWVELGTPQTSTTKVYDLAECRPTGTKPEPPPVVEPTPDVVEPTPDVVEPTPDVVEPTPIVEEQLVTFDYLLKTSFVSCAECHSKTKNPNKKPLLTNLVEYQARIADVVMAVNADDMPYTDKGARLLNACEKAMMNKWVGAGTPEASTIKVSEIPECKSEPPPPAEIKL